MDDIIQKLKQSKKAAVMAHISEDPDALGSCFAMVEALRQLGNDAVCYLSEKPEERLKFIGGKYKVYQPGQQQEHDLCICLDCGDRQRLGDRVAIFRAVDNSVNIDHHYTNDSFGDANYIDGKASATSEILYELFVQMGIEITEEIARYLYIAIAADTGCFKYSNVSPKTMRITAELLERDIKHSDITRLLFDTESLTEMKLKGALMGNIHSYCDGKLNLIAVDEKMFEKYGVDEGRGDLVNIPRRIENTEIAACIKRHKDKIKISLRSNGNVNVAEIAEKFGGGGHAMAAGVMLDGSMAAVQKQLVDYCADAISKIGVKL